jgi:Pyridoxal-phosphate dependent enzyme
MASKDSLEEEAHRKFWLAARTELLQRLACSVVVDGGFPVARLATATRIIVKPRVDPNDLSAPSSKTVSRFVAKKTGTLRYQNFLKSALCMALQMEATGNTNVVETTKIALDKLYEECRKATGMAFPSSSDPKRKKTSTTHLLRSLSSIDDPLSEDDPVHPEFPSQSPRYPATPIIPFVHDGLQIAIKDESANPTGSHKDRWAREQILQYKYLLLRVINSRIEIYEDEIPRLAMISGGSAALALQSALRLAGLPSLNVIVDEHRTSDKVVARLEAIGAIVTKADLDTKILTEDDVRSKTKLGGIDRDVTPRAVDEADRDMFYDWLTCEILRERPRYVFLPVGTGMLYASLIFFIEREVNKKGARDRRIAGLGVDDLRGIHVLGATSHESGTIMDKLYANHRPSMVGLPDKIEALKKIGTLGSHSGVYPLPDTYADDALIAVRNRGKGKEPINSEHSGIAGLGLVFKFIDDKHNFNGNKVLVVNTGRMYLGKP